MNRIPHDFVLHRKGDGILWSDAYSCNKCNLIVFDNLEELKNSIGSRSTAYAADIAKDGDHAACFNSFGEKVIVGCIMSNEEWMIQKIIE